MDFLSNTTARQFAPSDAQSPTAQSDTYQQPRSRIARANPMVRYQTRNRKRMEIKGADSLIIQFQAVGLNGSSSLLGLTGMLVILVVRPLLF